MGQPRPAEPARRRAGVAATQTSAVVDKRILETNPPTARRPCGLTFTLADNRNRRPRTEKVAALAGLTG